MEALTKNHSYTFTIFGGTGDLTYRKLLPALYNLFVSKQLIAFQIVIIGRRNYQHDEYCEIANGWIRQFVRLPYNDDSFREFCEHLYYYQMDFTQEAAYADLHAFYSAHNMHEHIFYFAVAPRFFDSLPKV